MAVISTQQLFDEVFDKSNDEVVRRNRNVYLRPELFEVEKKLGKQFIDFTVQDCIELMDAYPPGTSVTTYRAYVWFYKQVFEYYIDTYEPVRNPWNKAELSPKALFERAKQRLSPLDKKEIEYVINEIYKSGKCTAEHLECSIRLFYEGISSFDELYSITEDMVDLPRIKLLGRTITLSDRTAELLEKQHYTPLYVSAYRGRKYYNLTWHKSYMGLISEKDESIEDIPLKDVVLRARSKFSRDVTPYSNTRFNATRLWQRGLYDYLVSKLGKDVVDKAVTGEGSNDVLIPYLRDYGANPARMYNLLPQLSTFVV